MIKSHVSKKAFGVSVEHTELDDPLTKVYELQKRSEHDAITASESKKDQHKERLSAKKIRQASVKRLSETRKRNIEDCNESPKTSKRRNSGNDTFSFLREKGDREFELEKEKTFFAWKETN